MNALVSRISAVTEKRAHGIVAHAMRTRLVIAFIDIFLTMSAFESLWTCAGEIRYQVSTITSVLTWVGITVIDVDITIHSCKT
jgi:predicted KAP-like P-loop ATPase